MELAPDISEKVILIKINQAYNESISPFRLYEYTRGRWRVDRKKADQAEFAFALFKGEVLEVYKIEAWFESGDILSMIIADNNEYDQPKEYFSGRHEFVGRIARREIREKYKGKSLKHLFKVGEAYPIKYINI